MLYINPTDIRIIRNLNYNKPLCVLLENHTSFYNLIFNGNNSYSRWERKYKCSESYGFTNQMSELYLAKKMNNYYKPLDALCMLPPFLWENFSEQELEHHPIEKYIEQMFNKFAPFPPKNKELSLKESKVHICVNPMKYGFFSEEQKQNVGCHSYKVEDKTHSLTEISFRNKSFFKDAVLVCSSESQNFIYISNSIMEKSEYGLTNKSMSCDFKRD